MSECREWLNADKESCAAIWWHVDESDGKYQSNGLSISDCSRRIDLCFDYTIDDDDQKAEIRKKINKLYRSIGRFRAALLVEIEASDAD